MKKLCIQLSALGLWALFLLPMNSCRKAEVGKLALENGKAELCQCSITTVAQLLYSVVPPAVTLTFVYNSRGNPVTITPDFSSPSFQQWQFFYDAKGRLSQSGIVQRDGTFYEWHAYQYDNQDRAIGDSGYFNGLAGQRGTATNRWLTKVSYDYLNRVIKEVQASTGVYYSIDYTYNKDGNLASRQIDDNGQISVQTFEGYDSSASVLLTNSIWRFLARDYSVNSRYHPYAVNDYRLPTDYRASVDSMAGTDIGDFFFDNQYANRQLLIQYDCPNKNGGTTAL